MGTPRSSERNGKARGIGQAAGSKISQKVLLIDENECCNDTIWYVRDTTSLRSYINVQIENIGETFWMKDVFETSSARENRWEYF